MPPAPRFQLKITLRGSKPPIWRRLEVSADITLPELHGVIQTVMPWSNTHLHCFEHGDDSFGVKDPDWPEPDLKSEVGVRLNRFLKAPKDKLSYHYDFGDDWEHIIVLEKILPSTEERDPKLISGKRACPPEDIGGIYGFYEKLQILRDPTHPEWGEACDWWPGDAHPEVYDLAWHQQCLREGLQPPQYGP